MAYQVLARKWRPQDFSGVVGQQPIVTALRNALTEGRIAQAYLFSGIRGVGKTSVARVLAKALNCARGPAADPCNDCDPCRQITAGSDLDVIEVDAATYSKVEQVRDLTESLKYGPAGDRYKVVVVDEIHRLSRQAFDALLKIIEEPPAHLVFIFATTEIEAVPATILSRCQEFHFRRVGAAELLAHLRRLADAEHIQVSDTGLRMIARAGEGSVRDSVALLDQLATFGSGVIPDGEASRLLGGVDAALFLDLLTAISTGDGARLTRALAEVEQEGWDPRNVFTQFLAYARDGLHLALGGAVGDVELPAEDAAELAALAARTGYENLLRLMSHLLASEAAVRRSELGALALEIALLRAAELPKLVRLEELLSGAAAVGPGPAAGRSPRPPAEPPGVARRAAAAHAPAAPPPPAVSASAADAPTPPPPAPTLRPPAPAPPDPPVAIPSPPQVVADDEPAPWPDEVDDPDLDTPPRAHTGKAADFLEIVTRRRQSLAAHLAEARQLVFSGGELLIYTSPGDSWLASALERTSNRQILERALAETWGEHATWRLLEGKGDGGAAASALPRAAAVPPAAALVEHPTVQTLLDLFGGTAEPLEPNRGPDED